MKVYRVRVLIDRSVKDFFMKAESAHDALMAFNRDVLKKDFGLALGYKKATTTVTPLALRGTR